jgi:hypothetical protein
VSHARRLAFSLATAELTIRVTFFSIKKLMNSRNSPSETLDKASATEGYG